MPDLYNRSSQLEMLDMPIKDTWELRRNLREISLINKLLGGDRVTIKGLKKLISSRDKTYRIVDVGCGDGGLLRRIWHWARKRGYSVDILGIDIDPVAVRYAREKSIGYPGLDFQAIGYDEYFQGLGKKPDIIISALFCHHLDNERLQVFLKEMADNARTGFIINDLHRHFLAYYGIKWLTAIFSRSIYTRNDAPLSVWRGFKKKELTRKLGLVSNINYKISWCWAFRFLVIAKNRISVRYEK
jgi:SAM-dependent methyltransferase